MKNLKKTIINKMRSAFTLACVAAVVSVNASILDFAKNIYAEWPRTADEARAKYAPNGYQKFVTSPEHQKRVEAAHHSVMA